MNKQKFKQNDGYSTILTLVIVSVMLPIMVFIIVELGHIYNAKYQLEDLTENVVQTALYELDEVSLAEGELKLNRTNADSRVVSAMDEAVTFSGGVFNKYPGINVEIDDIEPSIHLKSSTTTEGIFLSQFFDLETESKQSISFPPKKEGTYTSPSAPSLGGVSASITKIVHPLWYDASNFPLGFGGKNKLAAFGNVEMNVTVDMPVQSKLIEATYEISFDDPKMQAVTGSIGEGSNILMFQVPSDISKGSSAYLTIEGTVEKTDANNVKTTEKLNGFSGHIGVVDKHLKELLQTKRN